MASRKETVTPKKAFDNTSISYRSDMIHPFGYLSGSRPIGPETKNQFRISIRKNFQAYRITKRGVVSKIPSDAPRISLIIGHVGIEG